MKLRPIFEHLRQMKSKRKQEFSADLKTLTGTLEIRPESVKEILENEQKILTKITQLKL